MSQPTDRPGREATFADLRAGQLARIPRPRPWRLELDPGDDITVYPLVRILDDPVLCRTCWALVTRSRDVESGRIYHHHLISIRPVVIYEEQPR